MVGSGDGARQLPVPGRPTTLEYGRAGGLLCLQQMRDESAVFFFFLFLFGHLVYPIIP